MPGDISDVVWNAPAHLVHARGGPEGRHADRLRRRPNGNSSVRGRAAASSRPCRRGRRHPARPAQRRPDPAHRARRRRRDRDRRHRRQRVGISPAGGAHGRGHRSLSCICWRDCCSGAARSACSRRLLALAEGMLFANSRIAMNDVYVTGFLIDGRDPVRAYLAGLLAQTVAGHRWWCPSSACCWVWRSRPSGSRPTPSAASCC